MVFKFLLNCFPTSLYSTHNMLSKSKYSPHGIEEKLIRLLLEISKVSKASSSTAQSSQSLSLGLFANASRILFLLNNSRTFPRKFLFRLRRPEREDVQRWERTARLAMKLKNLFTLQPFVLEQKLKLQGRSHKKRINFGNTAHSNVHMYMLR